MAEIGHRLRELRLQQGLAVTEVAQRGGLSAQTILNAEHGRNPRLDSLLRLLRTYGRLGALDGFLPASLPSPMALLTNRRLPRRRAPRRG